MPQFAANLHYLFSELPFLDRFEAAAAAGFKAVEFQVPYDYPAADLDGRLRTHGLKMVLFDAPMGDWARGDRGLAAVPGREKEFRDGLEKVVEYGNALGCDTVHLMAGVVGPGEDYKAAERTYIANLRHAAAMLADHGIAGVIEPINKKMGIVQNGPSYTTQGMHGYFLNHTVQARRVLDEVGSPNLLLHLDFYHMQMLEGNLAETIRENIGLVRHVQIAGVPGRHEPTVGEINYPFLFDLLDELGYT
jgi:hydroxypyruvate isomerase